MSAVNCDNNKYNLPYFIRHLSFSFLPLSQCLDQINCLNYCNNTWYDLIFSYQDLKKHMEAIFMENLCIMYKIAVSLINLTPNRKTSNIYN